MRAVQRGNNIRLMPADGFDWLDELPTTALCLFCPAERFDGTAAEAAEWNRQHRQTVHPGLQSMGPMARKKAARAAGAGVRL